MSEEAKIRQDPPLPARINRKMVIAIVISVGLLVALFASIGIRSGKQEKAKPEEELVQVQLPEGVSQMDYQKWLEQKAEVNKEPEKEPQKEQSVYPKFFKDRGKNYRVPENGGEIKVMPVSDTPEIKDMIRKLDMLAARMQGLEKRRPMAPQPHIARGATVDDVMNKAFGSPLSFKSSNMKKLLNATPKIDPNSGKSVNQSRTLGNDKSPRVSRSGSELIGVLDKTGSQGMQGEKRSFVDGVKRLDETIYMVDDLHRPKSEFELKASSIIPVTLYTGINSDLPGRIVAKVRNSIYDTVTGNWLLIPQGSTLIGEYDSIIAYGQERVLLAFSRIVFPNGNSINLEGAPGIDLSGYAGLKDKVNHHWVRLISGVVLTALVSASASEAENAQVFLQSAADSANDIGAEIAKKNLNIQPTITVRPGWKFNVFLHKDMILEPYTGETLFAKSNP